MLAELRHGVRARWARGPPPPFWHGESLTDMDPQQLEWWQREAVRLQQLGVINKISRAEARWVSKIFLVPKKEAGVWRMVVDLVHINTHATPGTAEVEGLQQLAGALRRHDHMVSLDLSDGFYHFRIHPDDQKYFQFSVGGEHFQLEGLNMGWCHSPGVFTDFLRVPVQHLRAQGARLLWYLDDFLLMGATTDEVASWRDRCARLFNELGLTLKQAKCVWEPVQEILHLGLVINSVAGTFSVDPVKEAKVRRGAKALLCNAAAHCRRAKKRELAKFVGLAQYLLPAVPSARFYLRALHSDMGTLEGWNGRVRISRQADKDLRWWAAFSQADWAGGPIWKPPTTALMSTDASDFGWGGAIFSPYDLEARGFWTWEERQEHITLKELRAVLRTLETHGLRLRHHHVRLLCDNQAVVAVINHATSRSGTLMRELRRLRRVTDFYNIRLQVEYIRSEDNIRADRLSRETDREDWALSADLFTQIGGPKCTVDRFASATNARLARFNSRWPCPGAEATDSLSLPDSAWRRELNYCNPPWTLMEQLAKKLMSSGAAALVVLPAWRHSLIYQLFREMADSVTRLPRRAGMFAPGRPVAKVGAPRWDVDIVRIPLRAPQATFGVEHPWTTAVLGLDEDD